MMMISVGGFCRDLQISNRQENLSDTLQRRRANATKKSKRYNRKNYVPNYVTTMMDADDMNAPVAIDLSRKKKSKRKRIIFVKTTRTPSKANINPALAATSVDARVEHVPQPPVAKTPQPKYSGTPSKHHILVATKMPKYSAEKRFGGKALSPLKSPTKGIVDDSSGQVLERRILGSADDYVDRKSVV
jgi:hypothetical protein